MNRHTRLFFVILLLFSACSKKVVSTSDTAAEMKEFKVNNLDFNYLTANSKIKFSDGKKNMSASANIRMKKDSIIWISVTPGLGIEAARGLITRDSVLFINRLNREYTAYSFQDLSRQFNFDITFDLIQAALLGNMLQDVGPKDKIKKESNYFVVRQEDGAVFIENFIGTRSQKLERVAIVEKESKKGQGMKNKKNTLNLSYDDFQSLEQEQVLPFDNMVSLDYYSNGQKKRTQININHKKASFADESLRFPFSIPRKYERQ